MPKRPKHLDRVFVSGEDGLLARALIRHLRAIGADILNDYFNKDWVNDFGWDPEVNVLDQSNMLKLCSLKPTTIIHTAALVNTDKCEADSNAAFECNVRTSYMLAEYGRLDGCYFVYFSTTAIYDPSAHRPLTESSRIKPFTLYGKTKWWGEVVVKDLVPKQDLLVLRPCFVYGGARDTSSVLARLVRQGLTGEPDVIWATLDPTKKKDFLWIEDFGNIAFELIRKRCFGEFNVARGRPRPYLDALKILESYGLRVRAEFLSEEDYLGDHIVDGSKAWKAAGVKPTIDLEVGIRLMVDDMRRRLDAEK